jgi:hypothetical protein
VQTAVPHCLARDIRQWIIDGIDLAERDNGSSLLRVVSREVWQSSQPPRYATFSHPHHPFHHIALELAYRYVGENSFQLV